MKKPTDIVLLMGAFGKGHVKENAVYYKNKGADVVALVDEDYLLEDSVCDKIIRSPNIFDLSTNLECIEMGLRENFFPTKLGNIQDTIWISVINLAQKLGLANYNLDTQCSSRLKNVTREILNRNNISRVPYKVITDPWESKQVLHDVGCPCVIKPISGAGSENVRIVNDTINLETSISKAFDNLKNKRDNFGDIAVNWKGRKHEICKSLLVEKYISGTEYSVEGIIDGNNIHVLAIHEKTRLLEKEGLVLDQEYLCPPKSSRVSAQISKTTKEAIEVLGLKDTAFHVEARYDGKNVFIVEVNPRIGGGYINDSVHLQTGVNLRECAVKQFLGENFEIIITLDNIATMYLIVSTNKRGRIKKIIGVEEVSNMPQVKKIKFYHKVGDMLGPFEAELDIMDVLITAPSRAEVLSVRDKIWKTVKVELE